MSIPRIAVSFESMDEDEIAHAQRLAFGEFLRAQRKARKWNQEEVAHRVGISQAYVGDWENGIVKRYAPADMRAWARCYDLPLVRIIIEAGFMSHVDLAAGDPTSHISPMLILLGNRLPALVNEDDVDLVVKLAWAARKWVEERGAPEVRTAGQTTQVETQETQEEERRQSRSGGAP